MRNVRTENVAEHSFVTSLIAHALCEIKNTLYGGKLDADRAAVLALYHESAEVFTGDLPTPIKYHSDDIRSAYKEIEAEAETKLLGFLPDELKKVYAPFVSQDKACPEYAMVKYADKIAALIKCNEELAAGNDEFREAKTSVEKLLAAADEKAVGYFMEHFMPYFGMSLDSSL